MELEQDGGDNTDATPGEKEKNETLVVPSGGQTVQQTLTLVEPPPLAEIPLPEGSPKTPVEILEGK